MSWIDEIEVSDAEGKLAKTYSALIEQRGKVANILKVHSLHAEALRRYVKDEDVMNVLTTADGLESLEPRLSNIVRHAEKLTTAPSAMTESDLTELRAEGLSDRDILDLTLIVAYFNFVNRIAMGLGVDFNQAELQGYRND